MTSQRVERTWNRTGGYRRFRGEWVKKYGGISCSIFVAVYCACLLASHGIPFGFETGSNPLFFTNVCDLSALKEEHKYVACKLHDFVLKK